MQKSTMRTFQGAWLLAAFVLLLAGGCGLGSSGYELVGQRGQHTYLVYVPPEYADDQAVYEQAIRDICTDPKQTYLVMFWNDRRQVWHRGDGEMTAEQAAAQVAGYSRIPETGVNSLYF